MNNRGSDEYERVASRRKAFVGGNRVHAIMIMTRKNAEAWRFGDNFAPLAFSRGAPSSTVSSIFEKLSPNDARLRSLVIARKCRAFFRFSVSRSPRRLMSIVMLARFAIQIRNDVPRRVCVRATSIKHQINCLNNSLKNPKSI